MTSTRDSCARLLLLTLLPVGACGHDCTLIGCDSGLIVMLTTTPPRPFTIDVLVPDGPSFVLRQSFTCDNPYCAGGMRIDDVTLTHVRVRVTSSGGVRETDFPSLEYVRTQPNGPDCDPLCISATIIAPVPN